MQSFPRLMTQLPYLCSRLVNVRRALLLAGVLGLASMAMQLSVTPSAHAATWLRYQRGYYLDHGWMCYGWSTGMYRCTQHWHVSQGHLVSDNTAWVPNYLAASGGAAHTGTTPRPSSGAAGGSRSGSGSSSGGYSGSVQSEIRAVFGGYAGAALRVAACESGFSATAYNRWSGASGVFQFLRSTWNTTAYAGYSPFNAWANIHAAYQVFARDGFSWREWTCKP
ncbi:MAG: hypothetical protein OJF49_000112 [Ktedonobacterales bacterium]|nr:MAG: hypothetical protein OJF49_000112 [Ktedonobacterales bacterium]